MKILKHNSKESDPLEIGDKIVFRRRALPSERDKWHDWWVPEMDCALGLPMTVSSVSKYVIHTHESQRICGRNLNWPKFLAERVEV